MWQHSINPRQCWAGLGSSTGSERRYQTPFYCGVHATFHHSSGHGARHQTVFNTTPIQPSYLMWLQCRDEDPLEIYFHPVRNIPSGGLPVPISIDKWRRVIGPLIASQSVRAVCDWSECWPRYPANTGGCLVPANCSAAAGLQCCLPRPRLARQIIYNQQLKGGFHCNCCLVRCYQSPVLAAGDVSVSTFNSARRAAAGKK